MTVGDEWLDDNFGSVPSDEQLLTPAEVGGTTLFGADITITSGIYPAELQAIARALAMFPLACSLHIHSDSQAAIAGIRSYSAQVNSRQRLRMAARPLLQLVTISSPRALRQAVLCSSMFGRTILEHPFCGLSPRRLQGEHSSCTSSTFNPRHSRAAPSC